MSWVDQNDIRSTNVGAGTFLEGRHGELCDVCDLCDVLREVKCEGGVAKDTLRELFDVALLGS